jgi:hypothetical protein
VKLLIAFVGVMTPPPAPGWYPDPSGSSSQVYWDGTAWSGPAGLAGSGKSDDSKNDDSKNTAVAVAVYVLVGIGFVMAIQPVSLFTGSGLIWTGVAVMTGGVAVAWFMRAANWVRVVAIALLAVSLVNASYIEKQLSDKRNELTHIFDR